MPKNVAADEYIIKNETNGRPYTASVLQRHFRKIRLHANLPSELCLGDLRRTGATEMADSGCTNAEMKAVSSINPQRVGSLCSPYDYSSGQCN